MTRDFYSSAIFFTIMYLLVGLFMSIISFALGERVLGLQSLASSAIFQFLMVLVWLLILLRYYHYKQYWFPFWAGVVFLAPHVFQFVLLLDFLATYELSVYYYPSVYLVIGMNTLHGLSLIFSAAGKRRWLKLAGIFMALSGLIMLSFFIWGMGSVDIRASGFLSEVQLGASFISSIGLVFFILNFRNERQMAGEDSASRQQALVGTMNAVGFIAMVAGLFVGVRVANESHWMLGHPEYVHEALAEIVAPFEARTYVNGQGDGLRYRLMKPLDYDSTKQYPLVISLHGSGGRGSDNARQIVTTILPQILVKPENRIKYPAFLFVPQCPLNSWWGGRSSDMEVDFLVLECILALEKEFPIDGKRRYVTGVSMGGYGTWHLIGTRPELFAAAVPIAGAGNPALAPNMVDVPVWAFHGAKDGFVAVSGSRSMIEAIKKAGGNPHYTEYPDKAHNLTEPITNTPELLDWLFAQKRE
ncbi:alpha/beta hydrolase-fold protein [Negadavirga shengliensis]|uniref:Alpha/beta hydrolase-fold protein n=1 Tax=Negadavirga shengliensis TaxID=1389218 RepID=A0ABV9T7A1_9BACT